MIFDPAIFSLYVNIGNITPTLPLPRQGGGNLVIISKGLPSPPRGEGRVRGRIPIFSHLPPSRGREFHLHFNRFTLSPAGKG
jgi:hypothetical protein